VRPLLARWLVQPLGIMSLARARARPPGEPAGHPHPHGIRQADQVPRSSCGSSRLNPYNQNPDLVSALTAGMAQGVAEPEGAEYSAQWPSRRAVAAHYGSCRLRTPAASVRRDGYHLADLDPRATPSYNDGLHPPQHVPAQGELPAGTPVSLTRPRCLFVSIPIVGVPICSSVDSSMPIPSWVRAFSFQLEPRRPPERRKRRSSPGMVAADPRVAMAVELLPPGIPSAPRGLSFQLGPSGYQ
jgi:hypothetical protein